MDLGSGLEWFWFCRGGRDFETCDLVPSMIQSSSYTSRLLS